MQRTNHWRNIMHLIKKPMTGANSILITLGKEKTPDIKYHNNPNLFLIIELSCV